MWRYIKALPDLFRRVGRLEVTADATTQEIQAIKADFQTYQTNVTAKIQALEAQLAAGGISPAAQAALDDLKATVAGAQVPA